MFLKKTIQLIAMVCLLGTTACQRTYTCVCSSSPISSHVDMHKIKAMNRNEANKKCQALTSQYYTGDMHGQPSCHLN
jgi:hypothetical protein